MGQFTFEEINLICCYIADTKEETAAGMTAALPFMEPEIKQLAERTLEKLNKLTRKNLQGFPLSLRRNNRTILQRANAYLILRALVLCF